jgi:prolyl oligopeptidase
VRSLAGLIALAALIAAVAEGSPDRIDQLRWLEPPAGERAVAWAREATAASTAQLTARPSYQQTLRELRQAIDAAPVVSDIALLGPYAVRFHRDAQHPKGVLQRADRTAGTLGAWRTVLDVVELNRSERADYDLHWASDRCLPPVFDRCLLSFSVAGGDEAVLREFDLAIGRFVKGGFSLPASRHVVAWLNRDAIVVGHDLAGARTTTALWPAEAYLWQRGASLQASRKVFTAGPTDALFQLYPLGEGRALLSQTVDFSTFILHVIDADGATTRLPLPEKLKLFAFQGATVRHLFVQFAEAATCEGLQIPAESIVSYDFGSEGLDRRRVAIVYTPADGEVISSLGFAATRSRVLFPVRADMRMRLLGARHDGKQWHVTPVARAEAGVDIRVTGADPIGEEAALLKEGFLSPPSIELLRESGSLAVLDRSPHMFDASTHAVEVRQARASDGELIDYLMIAPRQRRGRPVPTVMTGYGAFGISLSPAYPTTPAAQFYGGATLELWFRRGGALVVPAIRGGGERGAAWHRAAMAANRQRSYDDFIAVASDLVRLGIADRKHLGLFGTSNGGLLAAVAAIQRPDLFAAVVADAPLTDMLRFTEMGSGAAWTAEYGDPRDPKAAARLTRYSPLHNVRTGVEYPAFFITVAATDNRVGPGHARKLAKRLADLKSEAFFLEAEAGGHDVSDPLLRPEIMAMRATFLFDHLLR